MKSFKHSKPAEMRKLQLNCGNFISWWPEWFYVVKHPWSFNRVFLLYQKPRLVLSQGTSPLSRTHILARMHARTHAQVWSTFSIDPDRYNMLRCSFDPCLEGVWKHPFLNGLELIFTLTILPSSPAESVRILATAEGRALSGTQAAPLSGTQAAPSCISGGCC